MKKRKQILSLLEYCNDKQKMQFKRMYSPDDLYNRSYEDIIKRLSNRQIDHALKQIENTIVKNAQEFTL